MRFVDDLFAFYKEQFSGDENEAIMLIWSVLNEQRREDLVKLLEEMSDEEVKQMFSLYLIELLKVRMIKEGILEGMDAPESLRYH